MSDDKTPKLGNMAMLTPKDGPIPHISFPLITAERAIFDALLRERISQAVDIDALLILEEDLRSTVAATVENGGPPYDVAELIDAAWREMEGCWRELRKMQEEHCECPLCPVPSLGEHFEIDLGPAACGGVTGHARSRRQRKK